MNQINVSKYFSYKDRVAIINRWANHFAFLNIFLTLLVGIAYIYLTPASSTFISSLYNKIALIGHFSCVVFIVYLIFLFPLTFIGSLKIYKFLVGIIATFLYILLLIDIKLYMSIGIHLNVGIIDLFVEQDGFSTDINFNYLYVATPIIIFFQYTFSKLATKYIQTKKTTKFVKYSNITFIVCFFVTHLTSIWADFYQYGPITSQKTIFPAYYPTTASTFLTSHGWSNANKLFNPDKKTSKISVNFKYPTYNISATPKENPSNILIINVNELTFSDLTENNTPLLHQFAKKNDQYINHYIGTNNSIYNLFELLYGIPGQYMNIVKSLKTPSVLMSELKEQEYKIRFFITKNSDILKLKEDNPFDVRLKRLKIFNSNKLTLKDALKSINEKTSNPLMTYISLNTIDDNISKNQAFSHIDTIINEFLENINNINNTVVIITSLKGHNENYSSKNEADFYSRKNYHMPLIIKWPNNLTPNIHTSLTSMQDIVPTLGKEVLGINNEYIDYSTGANIYDDTTNRTWVLTGNNRTFYIITKDQTTIFDQYGNTSVYNDLGSTQENTKLSTIIKAMKLLTIYKGK